MGHMMTGRTDFIPIVRIDRVDPGPTRGPPAVDPGSTRGLTPGMTPGATPGSHPFRKSLFILVVLGFDF